MEVWWEERAIENVKVGSRMENVEHEVVSAKSIEENRGRGQGRNA